MDKRDEIIRTQMDVIESLISHNMRRVADDFWGTPAPKADPKPVEPEKKHEKPAAPAEAKQSETADSVAAPEEALPVEDIDDLKAELNELVGLTGVKKEVNNLINMVTVHKLRQQHGLKSPDMSLHMVFSGNPGTGKTTIARMMARIYRSLGILSKGQLVEVDRSGLVAGYVGQTATKTSKVIESALGGVLFIDEAYSLYRGKDDSFGLEAIDTLVKGIEDNRDDLVVVLAGYSKEMQLFLGSNSGLKSRFPNIIEFPDYTAQELLDIAKINVSQRGYRMDEGCMMPLYNWFARKQAENARENGNGRMVRNLVEKAILNQSGRMLTEPDADMELLILADFELDSEVADN